MCKNNNKHVTDRLREIVNECGLGFGNTSGSHWLIGKAAGIKKTNFSPAKEDMSYWDLIICLQCAQSSKWQPK